MTTLYFQHQCLLTPSAGQLNQTVLSDVALSFCRTTTPAVIENSSHKAVVALSEKIRAKLISIFDEFSRPELLEYNASKKSVEPVFTELEKGEFISNFINRKKDHSPFNPVYYSLILRCYCRVFDEFMNAHPSTLNSEEIKIQAKLQNEGFTSTQFNEEKKAKLENILIDRFVKGKDGNYLYTDKLISVVGFLMELPGDSAVPLKHDGRISETENNKKLITLFDLPSYLVDRSGHPTYGLEILKDCNGSPITIGNLFGGGLQGVFRDPMRSHLPNPNDAAIDLNAETLFKSKYKITDVFFQKLQEQVFNSKIQLNSGSTHFIYNENKEMTNQIGADLFQYAMKINKKLKKEGNFTAGISGNAMHCAIEA